MRKFVLAAVLVLIVTVYAVPVSALPVTSGLVGYWAADGNANDSSGNGNHGALQNGATFTTGMFGQAFQLDGVNDWISTPQSFSNDQSHTISAWINWSGHTASAFQEIVSWWNNPDPGLTRTFLGVAQGGSFGPMRYGDAWYNVPVSPPVGQWAHIAATYDGATNNRQAYLNGVLMATLAGSAEARFSTTLAIGRQGDLNGEFWNGLIDDLALYDRTLNSGEIAALANPVPEPTTGLLLGLGLLGVAVRRRV
jgi:hypothetical protein